MTRQANAQHMTQGSVVTKAAVRAAERLGLSKQLLGRIIGISGASVSRMSNGAYRIDETSKSFELAVLLIRLYRSLDAIAGGDDATIAAWMRAPNTALGQAPIERITTIPGLLDVVAYLDARRAPL